MNDNIHRTRLQEWMNRSERKFHPNYFVSIPAFIFKSKKRFACKYLDAPYKWDDKSASRGKRLRRNLMKWLHAAQSEGQAVSSSHYEASTGDFQDFQSSLFWLEPSSPSCHTAVGEGAVGVLLIYGKVLSCFIKKLIKASLDHKLHDWLERLRNWLQKSLSTVLRVDCSRLVPTVALEAFVCSRSFFSQLILIVFRFLDDGQ